ncbi:unnamed protein product [Blepharisma stoltei]|uniref:Iq calmodulin-binding motif family protein n=1 Tax=Blepharisma stoltei TaxID=1481888 RepID=A0AAU9KK68_9CILI|nr:unnamed protein product [Blepharisma stoltei]
MSYSQLFNTPKNTHNRAASMPSLEISPSGPLSPLSIETSISHSKKNSPKLSPRMLKKYLNEISSINDSATTLTSPKSTAIPNTSQNISFYPAPKLKTKKKSRKIPKSPGKDIIKLSSEIPKPYFHSRQSTRNFSLIGHRRTASSLSLDNVSETVKDFIDFFKNTHSSSGRNDTENISLRQRLYKMMKENPGELYRIVNEPNYTAVQQKKEIDNLLHGEVLWSEEHENAFKTLLRKTHSFNSMAKTRLFKELEKHLPDLRTVHNQEWNHDKRSPWEVDIDYHQESFYKQEKDDVFSKKKKQSISNIKRRDSKVNSNGEPDKTPFIKTQKTNEIMWKRKEFKDYLAGKDLVDQFETNKEQFDNAKIKLAEHIINKCQLDVKHLNQQRYAYLSAKIASQRANTQLSKTLLDEAEQKRQELRKRQIDFQRTLTYYKALVRKQYGEKYVVNHRRQLINTSHPINHAEFKSDMIKLGFLSCEEAQAKPSIATSPSSRYVWNKKVDLNSESLKNVSAWNRKEITNKNSQKKHVDYDAVAKRLQAFVRGVRVRRELKKQLKAVVLWQKAFRRYRAKKLFLKCIIQEQLKGGKKSISVLLSRYRSSYLYKKILTEIIESSKSKHKRIPKSSSGEITKIIEPDASGSKFLSDSPKEPELKRASSISSSVKIIKIGPNTSDSISSKFISEEILDLRQQLYRSRAEMWKWFICKHLKMVIPDKDFIALMNPKGDFIRNWVLPNVMDCDERLNKLVPGYMSPKTLTGQKKERTISMLRAEISVARETRDKFIKETNLNPDEMVINSDLILDQVADIAICLAVPEDIDSDIIVKSLLKIILPEEQALLVPLMMNEEAQKALVLFYRRSVRVKTMAI